ncbi:MAG: DUF1552 domain-containing protein [Planctomycetia bacterium]|nr:DUF1552 domain-containing protein [Planctomycetia bacterium]
MSISRRSALKQLALGSGVALSPAPWSWAATAAAEERGPRRVVFFLQNQAFYPEHAQPRELKVDPRKLDRVEDVALKDHALPAPIDPLEPIKDRITILQGINGKHVGPYHGAPFGALGGYRKSDSMPLGETIDCALGKALPAVQPALIFGWEALDRMKGSPIRYASSAWAKGAPAPMFCDPVLAFNNLFGVAKPGAARAEFDADTELFDLVKQDAERLDRRLSPEERAKFASYREGFAEITERRKRLLAMADTLAKHAPPLTDKFTKPRFDMDWWDASLDIVIAALVARVTNVATIASGCCHSGGSWLGLGLQNQGHSLGHTGPDNPDWLVLRRHNMQTLLRIVRALEAVPEGQGTMMDNTLIVYTSCHAEAQHSTGDKWPFLLIGNLGGRIRAGRYVQYPLFPAKQGRSINALYCSLLHAVGAPRDHFNLEGSLKGVDRPGPLAEVLT